MGKSSASNTVALGMVPFAFFGVDNNGVGMVLNLLVIFLVAIYLATVFWAWSDANRRLTDPVLIGSATLAALIFPYAGALVYAIVRPPETLEDAYERDLDVRAAELRVRLLEQAVKDGAGSAANATAVAGELSGEVAGRRAAGTAVSGSAPQSAGGARRAGAAAPSSGSPSGSPAPQRPQQPSHPARDAGARPSQSQQRPPAARPTRRPPASDA
jgi:hypothetical protein